MLMLAVDLIPKGPGEPLTLEVSVADWRADRVAG